MRLLKKKKANIQLSHLLSLSVGLFSCVVFWLFSGLFFSIVSEAGASIYSVSPEAAKEMPDLDPNLRSAGMEVYLFYHCLNTELKPQFSDGIVCNIKHNHTQNYRKSRF